MLIIISCSGVTINVKAPSGLPASLSFITNQTLPTKNHVQYQCDKRFNSHLRDTCCLLHSFLTDVSVWYRFILPERLQTLSVKLLNPQRWNDPKSQVSFCIYSFFSVWVRQLQAPLASWLESILNWVKLNQVKMV